MGAGASFPMTLNEEQAKELAKGNWNKDGNKQAFQRLAKKQGGVITGYQMQMLLAQADAKKYGGYATVKLRMAKELATNTGMMNMFSSKECKATLEHNGQQLATFDAWKEVVIDGTTKALFDSEKKRITCAVKWWIQPGDPQEVTLRLKVGSAEEATTTFKLFDFCNLNVGVWAALDGGGGKVNFETWFAPRRAVATSKKDFTATKEKNLEESSIGGICQIKVRRANGLAPRDTKGMFSSEMTTSDPFVRVIVDDEEVDATPTIDKNLDPEWEHHVTPFSIGDGPECIVRHKNRHTLLFDIEDKDAGMLYDGEKTLGKVEIPMASLANTSTELAFDVKPHKGFTGATGTLTVKIFYAVCPAVIPKMQAMSLGKLDESCMPVQYAPANGQLAPMPAVAFASYQQSAAAVQPQYQMNQQQMQSQMQMQQQMQQQMQMQSQMQQMQFEQNMQMMRMQNRNQSSYQGGGYRDHGGYRYYRPRNNGDGNGNYRRTNAETGEDEEVPEDEEDLPEDLEDIDAPEELPEGEEAPDEEEGGAEEGGAEEVDMYGACPQDLPDGGPSGGAAGPAVRSSDPSRPPSDIVGMAPVVVHTHAAKRKQQQLERTLQIREMQAKFDASASIRTQPLVFHAEFGGGSCDEQRAVTIVTQASMDRLGKLEAMAAAWTGPLVCALYARPGKAAETVAAAAAAHARVLGRVGNLCSLEILVVGENKNNADADGDATWDRAYPINRLRNAALARAATDLVFSLDVDFVPSPGLHDRLVAAIFDGYAAASPSSKVAFVVPAVEVRDAVFEALGFAGGAEAAHRALGAALATKEASAFHVAHYPRGHAPTGLTDAWFSTRGPYEVRYAEGYEPYVVARREHFPPYDERFRGYGLNKVVHAYAMAAAGFKFVVMPGAAGAAGEVGAASIECGFVAAAQHNKSDAWENMYGKRANPQLKDKVQALYNRAKLEVDLAAAVAAKHSKASVMRPPVQPSPASPSSHSDCVTITVSGSSADTGTKKTGMLTPAGTSSQLAASLLMGLVILLAIVFGAIAFLLTASPRPEVALMSEPLGTIFGGAMSKGVKDGFSLRGASFTSS